MPTPLIATRSRLLTHFKQSGSILASAADTSAKLKVEAEFVHPRVVGGLFGSGCELVTRNRGRRVPVAPLIHLGQGLWVWLGYHEEWDEERPSGRIHRYSFRSVALSIHFGLRNNTFKPQMFRAEWAGWARWGGSGYSFQAANAGHPHWQFDALDSLPDSELLRRAEQLLRRLRGDPRREVREFSPQLSDPDVRDFVTTQKFSRIHFASAAAWWKAPPHGDHAHYPTAFSDIQNWVRHSVNYIKVELDRL